MKRHHRRSSLTIRTDVDIDIDEVMEELSDEDLSEELNRRQSKKAGSAMAGRNDLKDAYDALLRNDKEEAVLILHALLFPRFPSPAAAFAEVLKSKGVAS